MDYKPLVDLFELLLEWDMKNIQEKKQDGASNEI